MPFRTPKFYNLSLHPLFFALYLVLAVMSTDATLLFYLQGTRLIWAMPLIAIAAMLVVQWLSKDWHYTGFAVTMGIICLGYYGHVYRLARTYLNAPWLNHTLLFGLWAGVFIGIAGPWTWKKVQKPELITQFFNLIGFVAVLFPLVTTIQIVQQIQKLPLSDWEMPAFSSPDIDQNASRPDIYYIILDGYARADVLENMYNFDNRAFLEFLDERGFYVAEQSKSNYPRTGLSLPASLNFDYLQNFIPETETNTDNWFPMQEMIAHSRAREVASKAGYQFVSYSSGFFYTEIRDADRYLSQFKIDLNEFEQLVLSTTALDVLFDQGWLPVPSFSYHTHRQRVLYPLTHLGETADPLQPKLIFAHILIPHPPFIFDQEGNFIEPQRAYSMSDGIDYEDSIEAYRQHYASQITYTNQRIQEMIDRILANATERGVVIVIQADHGPRSSVIGQSDGVGCLYEQFNILNAYYMPSAKSELYPTITPVNTFRIIFDHYLGTQLGLLPDISYYSSVHRPYQFENVTTESDIPCNP